MAMKYPPQILLEVPNRLPPARTQPQQALGSSSTGPPAQVLQSLVLEMATNILLPPPLLLLCTPSHHGLPPRSPQHRQALAWAGQPVGFASTRVDGDCRRVSSELMAGAVSLLYLYRSVDHAAQNNSLLLVGHTIYSALAWQEWDKQC